MPTLGFFYTVHIDDVCFKACVVTHVGSRKGLPKLLESVNISCKKTQLIEGLKMSCGNPEFYGLRRSNFGQIRNRTAYEIT